MRIQIDLPKESERRVRRLMAVAETDKVGDVMKDALRLYEFFVDRMEKGLPVYDMINGEPVELKLFD